MASGPDADRSGALAREAAAYLLLESVRWPDGPSSCPHCGAAGRCRLLTAADGLARPTRTGRLSARRIWRCGHCRRQFSVLSGTVFERTKVALPAWLDALQILSVSLERCSAAQLAHAVGVSVDTARVMLHLVRSGLSAAAGDGPAGCQFQG